MPISANEVVKKYCKDVLAGKILCGKNQRLCVERHVRDLKTKKHFYFSEKAAQHVIDFFSLLKHSKGKWAGQPLDLQPWQIFCLAVEFGWIEKSTGLRRFREAWNEVPRKNGKSTISAGKALYLLIADGEPGAEIYTAATKKEQARIIFEEARSMVAQSAALSAIVKPFRNSLVFGDTFSKIEPLSSEDHTLDGLNIHGALIDEIHAHKTSAIYDVLKTGVGSRQQPMIDIVTTAGVSNEGPGIALHNHAVSVIENVVEDDRLFIFIASADIEDVNFFNNEKVWRKANPNYGISVNPEDIKEQSARAVSVPSFRNTFLIKRLNLWVQQSEAWLSIEKWNKLGNAKLKIEEFAGQKAYLGLDLSQSIDLSAVVVMIPVDKKIIIFPYFFVPEDEIFERAKIDRVPYDVWATDGVLTATPGAYVDIGFIEAKILEISKIVNIKRLSADTWNAQQFLARMHSQHGISTIGIPQTMGGLSPATKEFEKLLVSNQIEHDANPLMTWMVSNVSTTKDSNQNIKPDKSKSRHRIDGVVAAITGLAGMRLQSEDEPEFVYNNMGIYVG